MNPIKCFLLTPTGSEARYLRRYGCAGVACPADPSRGYHCAMTRISVGPAGRAIESNPPEYPPADPRWPTQCACGYVFADGDDRQLFRASLYADASGRMFSIHGSELPHTPRAPAGAMWFADWMPHAKGPDGRCLVVRCPAKPDGSGVADWMVDGGSLNGNGWTRTGEPPNVTANPSIFISPPHGFHGWLRNGELVGC